MSLNICKTCGKEFRGAGKADVYCCDECRIKGIGISKGNMQYIACDTCGGYTWLRPGQLRCNACRKAEYFKRHRDDDGLKGKGKYKYEAKERPTQINTALNDLAAKARAAGMNYGEYTAKVRCGLI